MQHPDSARQRLASASKAVDRTTPPLFGSGNAMRLAAAMAGPFAHPLERGPFWDARTDRLTAVTGNATESEAQYFRRRAAEEHNAAEIAAGPEARNAHQELADRYAKLAQRAPGHRRRAGGHHAPRATAPLVALLRQHWGLQRGTTGGTAPPINHAQ